MKQSKTLMGISFSYDGNIESDLIVYRATTIHIPQKIIAFIKNEIIERNPVLMGANRDNPTFDSIGESLLDNGYSPQNLSYVIPLLIEDDFCTASKKRPFLITKT